MSFNILNYLDVLNNVKEYPTYIQADCPVCGGTLKISKNSTKYGAYACYTDDCSKKENNLIRQKLYNPKSVFNKPSIFKENTFSSKNLIKIVKELTLDTALEYSDFISNVEFVKPEQTKLSDGSVRTIFNYPDFNVVRLDTIKSGKKVKYFYQQYLDCNGSIVEGIPETFTKPQLYKLEYLQSSIVIVEGEKCAAIAHKLNIAAITFPSFLFSEVYVARYSKILKSLGVANVLYIRDNDHPGLVKSKYVVNNLWDNDIKAKSVNLADIYSEYSDIPGFDLFDLYKAKNIDAKTLIEDCLLCQ